MDEKAVKMNGDELEGRVIKFDHAIRRIAHHVGACCAGVDVIDDNRCGSHTDQEIIKKIDSLLVEAKQQGFDMASKASEAKIADLTARLEAQEASEPVAENGKWSIGKTDDGRYFVESDDFTHDVRLYLNGDFSSGEQRHHYLGEIISRLNLPQPTKLEASEPVAEFIEHAEGNRWKWMFHELPHVGMRLYATPQPSTEKVSQEPDPQLCRFYGVDSFPALVEAQEKHIVKLQKKVAATEKPQSLYPPRVREG